MDFLMQYNYNIDIAHDKQSLYIIEKEMEKKYAKAPSKMIVKNYIFLKLTIIMTKRKLKRLIKW